MNKNKIINQNYSSKHIKDPYHIWIIDDFMNEEVIDKLNEEWLANTSEKWHSGRSMVDGENNILEKKMLSISKIEDMPYFIASVCSYLHSDDFTRLISKITNVDDLISDVTMRWSGMRVMMVGSHQLIHSDARKHPENGLRKEITCLLYLNDNYEKDRDEGCLEVWNDDMTECIHQIEPINNRLVMFQNSDTSYHGVPLVKKDRKAILFSVMKDESCSSRNFAQFVKRPEDPDVITELGIKRGMGK